MRLRDRFGRDEAGVSAVEFAAICPVLVTLLMACIEFGLIIYSYNAAQNAARDVARKLATNRLTTDQASATAKGELPAWVVSGTTVTVTQSNPTDTSKNQFTLSISFPASAAAPTGYLAWAYSGLTLQAKATMQQELAL